MRRGRFLTLLALACLWGLFFLAVFVHAQPSVSIGVGPVVTPLYPEFTVAQLPASPTTGTVVIVTDAAAGDDCVTGGGTANAQCRWDGAAWEAVGGGGVGGGGTSESPIIIDADDAEAFLVRKDGDAGDVLTVDTIDSQIVVPDGSNSLPSLRGSTANSGVYFAGGVIQLTVSGIRRAFLDGTRLSVDAGRVTFDGSGSTSLLKDANATIQMGVDAASPIPQGFKAHDASGTDNVGADLIFGPGNGTGTGNSGKFRVQSAPPGVSSSNQNTPVDRFVIDTNGNIGIGLDAPEALLHIARVENTRAPLSTARLFIEDTANAAIEIVTGANSVGSLIVSDPGGNNRGQVAYTNIDDDWTFRAAGISDLFKIKGTGGFHSAPQATPPPSPVLGDFYVDSDINMVCFYNSVNWVQMDDFSTVCS